MFGEHGALHVLSGTNESLLKTCTVALLVSLSSLYIGHQMLKLALG